MPRFPREVWGVSAFQEAVHEYAMSNLIQTSLFPSPVLQISIFFSDPALVSVFRWNVAVPMRCFGDVHLKRLNMANHPTSLHVVLSNFDRQQEMCKSRIAHNYFLLGMSSSNMRFKVAIQWRLHLHVCRVMTLDCRETKS